MKSEIMLPVPELKKALSGLNKLVGKKTTLPVLSHVRVSRQKNGMVTLQGTDLDAFATFTLNNTQTGEPVDVLVPLDQLNKASKCSSSKDAVALVCEGKSTKLRYNIGGNPVHQPINTLPVNEWPPIPEIKTDSSQLPPGFGETLKQALTCCSDDPSRYVLRGACLDARDAKAHYVVGTNGRFLFAANSFTFPIKEAVIIPDSKFINGSGLLDDEPCFLAIQPGKKQDDKKLISLHNKQWELVTREIDGQYPNWKQVLPTINGSWTIVKLSPPAVEQMLKVIPNLPGNDGIHNTVRLRTGEKALWVEGKNKDDKDWTKIAVQDVTITGKQREIALNRDYLLPALKFGLDELAILDELSPMVCSKNGKQMVIMPVRVNGEATTTEKPKPTPTPIPPTKPETKTERTKMPRTARTTSAPTPTSEANGSAVTDLLGTVDQIKENVKSVLGGLNILAGKLKSVEKEKRVTEREIESIRKQLRKIQTVTI